MTDSRNFLTQAVHAGLNLPAPQGKPVSPPIHPAATYTYDDMEDLSAALHENRGYCYARYGSPTLAALEQAVAELEGTEDAVAYASGMGALHGVFAQAGVSAARPILTARDVYGATDTLLRRMFAADGALHFVDITNGDTVKADIERLHPRAVFLETISNPLLKIPNIPHIVDWAHQNEAIVIVDNTFATPFLYRPVEHGVDVIVHSATKYLGGHGDVLGGAAAMDSKRSHELRLQQRSYGANLGPFEAWLVLRGIRTLPLRMREQCANALRVALWLSGQEAVSQVIYPGLPVHPNHQLACRLFRENHFGGMVAFDIRGAGEPEVFRFMEALQLIQAATSLGDVYSLLLYPAQSSHHSLGREERLRQGIGDGLVRLSVGVEAAEDIIADLQQALNAICPA
jgi:cystathionine beta-lyase/cystathionine gamma-synthase